MHIFHPRNEIDVQRVISHLRKLPIKDERGREYLVIVQRIQQKTRIPQKGLFYVWAKFMADHVGESPSQMAHDLKHALLPIVETINKFTGEITYERQSTEDLTPEEWNRLLLRVEALAAEHFGISLPRKESEYTRAAYQHYSAAMAAGDER